MKRIASRKGGTAPVPAVKEETAPACEDGRQSISALAKRMRVSESSLRRHLRDHCPVYVELMREYLAPNPDNLTGPQLALYNDSDEGLIYLPEEIVRKIAAERFRIVETEEDRKKATKHFVALVNHHTKDGTVPHLYELFRMIERAWPAFRVLG